MVSTTAMIVLAFLTASAATAQAEASDTLMIQLATVANGSNAVARMAVPAASPTEYWQQMGGDIDGANVGNGFFGKHLSLSADGTRVVVGAPDDNGAGYASVYEYSNSAWVRMGDNLTGVQETLPNGNPSILGDNAGSAVSLSADGTRVAVGAPGNNGVDENSGRVRIYDYSASSWHQVGDIAGAEYGNNIGTAVSLSADGDRVAIGSRDRGGRSGNNNKGYVDVYEYSSLSSSWQQIGATIAGDDRGERAGQGAQAVALSADGTRLAIGAANKNNGAGGEGRVRVFEYSSSSWVQVGADLNGAVYLGQCGKAVSLSLDGSRVAFSCPREGASHVGHEVGIIRVFDYSASSWQQVGGDIIGPKPHAQAGDSISLSADGNRLGVGVKRDRWTMGLARVYEYDQASSSWVVLGNEMYGESSQDYSGCAVAMSANGAWLAVGAAHNDASGSNAGHVRVHKWISPTPPPTPAPTSSPTTAPQTGVSAKGDPHLTNLYGQRFDVLQEGMYVFAHVPRLAQPVDTLLKIEADVQRLGDKCGDLYIQAVNVTGEWADAGDGKKGVRYDVGMNKETKGWRSFHQVKLKVAKGKTMTGAVYLNVYVKNLEKIKYDVGGLLGIDDHTLASTAPKHCRKSIDL